MSKIIGARTQIILVITPPAQLLPPPPPIFVEVLNGHNFTIKMDVARKSDIEATLSKYCSSISYMIGSFTLVGSLKFKRIIEINLSSKTYLMGQPVVLEGEVKAIFNKSVPATDATTGAPDPNAFYICTFQLKSLQYRASSK